jgi:citrate synthase
MDRLAPSAYHDPREVVWKHLVAQGYWDVLDTLRGEAVAIEVFEGLRQAFLKAFNGQHDIALLCAQVDPIACEVIARLRNHGCDQASADVERTVASVRTSLHQAMQGLQSLRHVERGASYVAGGSIMIAGKAAEAFAANPDWILATLELVGETSLDVAAATRDAWQQGFLLPAALKQLIGEAARDAWRAEELLAEVLLYEQRSGRHPTLRAYEFVPTLTAAENRRRKLMAVEQGYFLLGRLMSCIGWFNRGSTSAEGDVVEHRCPIGATLAQAGIRLTAAQLDAFRRFVLVRAAHGLNPGEFAARIAASVRTSFPQALVTSVMVRAGNLHGGALRECMKLLDAYLAAPSRSAFLHRSLEESELYGFGHRIHKANAAAGEGGAVGDPRVGYLLATAREAFPDMDASLDAFEALVADVRKAKPSLAANNDFGAAVWFHCLKVSREMGTALFTMARLPGMVAQIINQLDVKGNALRPPLAVNLPYAL